jgi:hypothetical protein
MKIVLFMDEEADHSDGMIELFAETPYDEFLRNQHDASIQGIHGIDKDVLLNTDIAQICQELEPLYRINVPVLQEAETFDPEEVVLDVSNDPLLFRHRLGKALVPHTKFVIDYTYRGDASLFRVIPSHYWSPLRGVVSNDRLRLIFHQRHPNEEQLKDLVSQQIKKVEENLEALRADFHSHNETLSRFLLSNLEARRTKLLANRKLATSLGFPLKERNDIPTALKVPLQPKSLPLFKNRQSAASFQPEPELDMQAYEQILELLAHMAVAMERSPHVVAQMQEEDLRFLFLFLLNATYEGQATGETFNMAGKVDILIRVEDRTIFLAECKFWRGPASLRDAIDQLLSYTTWRDSKTSILLFNRTKGFSSVLAKIPEVVQAHPNCLRQLPLPAFSETQFRYKFTHPHDPERQLYVTILAFDIPTE